ncbi:helix-turn-helix domain-containing protein, partial [Candidatus Uhrbacteria bacterium]|nr:helix-turn-helix domain-containing protein [Candidatus Uhrbacteria bacterium]
SLLASSPGQVFSSDDIVEALWSRPSYATGQDAQKYVYLLRRKIERDPTRPEIILTVRGFGYRLAL